MLQTFCSWGSCLGRRLPPALHVLPPPDGTAKVAVDVGYGQLAWKLREDPRVVCIERTNIRHYGGEGIAEDIDIAVIDASFISLRIVIPPVLRLIQDDALILALVKPQFEVGRNEVGKRGVVRDPALHDRVLAETADFCRGLGLEVLGNCVSPLLGPEGNREFFLYLRKRPAEGDGLTAGNRMTIKLAKNGRLLHGGQTGRGRECSIWRAADTGSPSHATPLHHDTAQRWSNSYCGVHRPRPQPRTRSTEAPPRGGRLVSCVLQEIIRDKEKEINR